MPINTFDDETSPGPIGEEEEAVMSDAEIIYLALLEQVEELTPGQRMMFITAFQERTPFHVLPSAIQRVFINLEEELFSDEEDVSDDTEGDEENDAGSDTENGEER